MSEKLRNLMMAVLLVAGIALLSVSYVNLATSRMRVTFQTSGNSALWIEKSNSLLYQSPAHMYVIAFYMVDQGDDTWLPELDDDRAVFKGNIFLGDYSGDTATKTKQFAVLCSEDDKLTYEQIWNLVVNPHYKGSFVFGADSVQQPQVLTCDFRY